MAIRFEYGPPPSALGALAYQAGAAEAADKRRREIEQMQMQAAQMRQQQQQNALNRQFDSWKTQYSHHSSLDKMQRDYKWREEQAEQNRALEKEKFGLQNERKDLEWDRSTVDRREMFKLEAAENNRRDIQDQQQWLEQEQKKAETAQDVARVQKLSDKSKLLEARQWKAITPEAQREVMEIDRKIEAVQASEQFMPQPLEDQRDPSKVSERQQKVQNLQKKRQAILADPKKQRKDLTQEGGEEITPLTISTRVNGKLEERPNPMATAQDAERKYGVTDEVFYDMKTNRPYKNKVVRDDNPSSKTGWKVIQAGTGGKSAEEKQQDVVTRDEAINDAYKNLLTEDDFGAQVLTARGRAVAKSQGRDPDKINESKNFDPVITEHVNTMYKPEKAGPDPGEGAALDRGGPFSTTGGQPVVGGQPTATTTATTGTGLGGGPAVEAAVQATEAGKADPQTAAVLAAAVAEEEKQVNEMAEGLRKDFSQDFTGSGAGTTSLRDLHDPNITEEERRRRQKVYSERLQERGRERTGKGRPAHWPVPTDVRRNPVPGVHYGTTPDPLAKPVEAVTGRVVETPIIGEKVNPWQMLYGKKDSLRSKIVKSVGDVRRAVKETSVGKDAAPYKRTGADQPEVEARKKREAETKDIFKLYSAKKEAKKFLGKRISMPKGKYLGSGRYRTLSKKAKEEFNGDLRKHTRRLVNNKDASKDTEMRLDRIMGKQPTGKGGVGITREGLKDEIRVIKMVGRASDASKPFFLTRNKVWKDFLSKDLSERKQLVYLQVHGDALVDALKDAGF